MTYSIRPVARAELPDLLALNEAELPHVGSVDLEQLRWFAEHASCFRTAVSDGEPAAFLIGLSLGLAPRMEAMRAAFPFEAAHDNFYRAAQSARS